ncbi:Low complexity protein [Cryptosporidium ryanae]|uniref:Low complexity protein n=1 Tax=Cryptosporidium ryanae TaxID=515981 RepID=UPI00351A9A15|nr:Low complexity protein [Cryptosporidium ryanae]
MEVLTYDDIDSLRFIHGPRLRFEFQGLLKILVCNKLKYIIFAKKNQVQIYKMADIFDKVYESIPYEFNSLDLKKYLVVDYQIPYSHSISGITLDYSSTVLTVICESGIILYDLLNVNEFKEWNVIDHTNPIRACWTEKNDIVIIDLYGNCFLYRYNNFNKKFTKVKFQIENSSYIFKFVESCEKNDQNISLIFATEGNKCVIILTSELYNEISFDTGTFVIPDSFIFCISEIIKPIKESVFLNQAEVDSQSFLDYFNISCLKFLNGKKNNYLSITLVGGRDYIDVYVLFLKIDSENNINISSYSINDLCFDNTSNDLDKISKIDCTSIWVKEWELLFMGTSLFSQMVIFTCDESYITSSGEPYSKQWFRLGMSEGYDINCTDFETGIFDAGICTCTESVIKDPKLTIDSPQIKNPPIFFISQTDGDIIVHFIASSKLNKIEYYESDVKSIIHKESIFNNKTNAQQKFNTCTLNINYNSEHHLNKQNIEKSSHIKQGCMESSDTNYFLNQLKKSVSEIGGLNSSGSNILDVLSKIEVNIKSLEDKFRFIYEAIDSLHNSSPDVFGNMDDFIKNFPKLDFNNEKFDELINKYGGVLDLERQIRRIYFGMIKKFPEKIYKSSNFEKLRRKFRRNELTSNQVSILFYINNSILHDFIKSFDAPDFLKIMESLSTTGKQCLKLASRISQVSKFCQRLNSRVNNCLDSDNFLLPPSISCSVFGLNDISHEYSMNDQRDCEQQVVDISSTVKAVRNPDRLYQRVNVVNKFSYSPLRRIDSLSDVINNISNFISPNKEALKQSIINHNEFSQSSIQKTNSYMKDFDYSTYNKDDGCINLRSKTSVFTKIQNKKVPYFESNWNPTKNTNSIHEYNSPLKGNRNFPVIPHIITNYSSKSGDAINSTLWNCHEQLERIIDQCNIIQGSISFIKRENLVSKNIFWQSNDFNLVSSNKGVYKPNCDSLMICHILLLKSSNREKNKFYRQMMNSLFTNNIFEKNHCDRVNVLYSDISDLSHDKVNSFGTFESSSENLYLNTKEVDNVTASLDLRSNSIYSNDKKFQNVDSTTIKEDNPKNIVSVNKLIVPENLINNTGFPSTEMKLKPETTSNELEDNKNFFTLDQSFKHFNEVKNTINDNTGYNFSIWDDKIKKSEKCDLKEDCNNFVSINENFYSVSLSNKTDDCIEEASNMTSLLNNDIASDIIRKIENNVDVPEIYKDNFSKSLFFEEINKTQDSELHNDFFGFSTEIKTLKPNLTGLDNPNDLTGQTQYDNNSLGRLMNEGKSLKDLTELSIIPDTTPVVPESKEKYTNKISDSNESTNIFSKTMSLGGIFGGISTYSSNSPVPTASGFGSSQFLINGPFSNSFSDQKQTDSQNPLITSSLCSNDSFSFGITQEKLTPGIPFSSKPINETQIGGFTSKSFSGFSSLLINSDNSNGLPSNHTQFSFAPPPKPRQVSKLD